MLLKTRATYRFDGFLLDGRQRLLERDGVPVNIAPKVLDALLLLVENAGTLVERSTVRERLWPGQIVEEGTLARVIADLRKALGDVGEARRYIETVPKFGYRFVVSVTVVTEAAPAPLEEARPARKRKWAIPAAAGLLFVALGAFAVRLMQPQPPAIQSVVILPFQTIGTAPDAGILDAGLQDSLTMELSGLSGLAVIKANPAADGSEDAASIGRKHRAAYVLAGTIQLTTGRIEVNARLVKSATGEAVWSKQFEEHADDVFLVESRLAKLAVAELLPALPVVEGDRFIRKLPTNASAYRDYLLGRYYWNKRDAKGFARAIDMFQKAIAADPSYAPAYVGLADSYLLSANSRDDRAKVAAAKALQIDPSLGEAHATLAMIASSWDFNWDKAENELRTAIRLAPNYVTAHHWYAEFLTMTGKFDLSEAEFEVARNLDPASPIIVTDLAQLYNFEKKYERSMETLDEALKLEPSFSLAHYRKGYALMLLRRPREALAEFDAANRNGEALSGAGEKAWVAAAEGRRQDAIELARQAEREGTSAFVISATWTQLGEFGRAMEWLQKMYDSRAAGLVSLKVNPVFDPLRTYEPFKALLRKMNMN